MGSRLELSLFDYLRQAPILSSNEKRTGGQGEFTEVVRLVRYLGVESFGNQKSAYLIELQLRCYFTSYSVSHWVVVSANVHF